MLRADLHNVLLEQLGYGELLSVRCFKSRRIILTSLTSIRLLLLSLDAESRTAPLQSSKEIICMRSGAAAQH